MHSAFLTLVNVGLGLYSILLFLKLLVQFGLPNHPGRFTAYLVFFCTAFFFGGQAAVGFGLMSPWQWMNLQALPLVAGSLALLLQTIMMVGEFSLIQQKVVSRLPLIAGLVVLAIFPGKAELFFSAAIAAGCIFLLVSKSKARYQKRMFFKMIFFLGLSLIFRWPDRYGFYVVGQLVLFFVLFYLSLFEQAFGVSALIDEGVQE